MIRKIAKFLNGFSAQYAGDYLNRYAKTQVLKNHKYVVEQRRQKPATYHKKSNQS